MEIKIVDTFLLLIIYITSLFSIAGYGKMTTFFLGDNKNNNLGRKINDLEIIQIINLNSYHKKHSIIIARY